MRKETIRQPATKSLPQQQAEILAAYYYTNFDKCTDDVRRKLLGNLGELKTIAARDFRRSVEEVCGQPQRTLNPKD